MGADRGGAEAGGDRGRGQEAGLEGDAPDQQVPAEHQLLADQPGAGAAAATRSRTSAADEQAAGEGLRDRRWPPPSRPGRARPGRPAAGRAPRRAGWGRARSSSGRRVSWMPRSQPLPAAASSRPGAPSAAMRSHCAAASATSPAPPARVRASAPAAELHGDAPPAPRRQGEPGRLHALGHRRGPVAGPEAAGRPPGRAVRDDGAEPGGERHHGAADGERGQRHPAEVPDHRGVDQDVERLGGEHHEGRQGERGDPPRRGDAWTRAGVRWLIAADPGSPGKDRNRGQHLPAAGRRVTPDASRDVESTAGRRGAGGGASVPRVVAVHHPGRAGGQRGDVGAERRPPGDPARRQ